MNEQEKTLTVPSNVVVNFTWSPSKDSQSREAEATFDLSKLTGQDILDYAIDSITIKLQGQLRRQFGTEKYEVPRTKDVLNADGTTRKVEIYSVEVAKPGERKVADPAKKAALAAIAEATGKGVSMEEIAKLVAELAAKKAEEAKAEDAELEAGENEPAAE